MGSKFISTSGDDLTAVSDGSLDILGASLGGQNLTPGFPIKVDSERKLYSTNLVISDIVNLQLELDKTIQTPYNGVIKASDFETDEYFSANDEFRRIENIYNLGNRTTNIDGMLKTTEIKTDRIYDAGGSVFIHMDETDINFSATNLTFNGVAIGSTDPVEKWDYVSTSAYNPPMTQTNKYKINSIINSNDNLYVGTYYGLNDQGTEKLGASIQVMSTAPWTATNNSTRMVFATASINDEYFDGNAKLIISDTIEHHVSLDMMGNNIFNIGDKNTNISKFIDKIDFITANQSGTLINQTDFKGKIKSDSIEPKTITGNVEVINDISFNKNVIFKAGSEILGDVRINDLSIGGGVMCGISDSQKIVFGTNPANLTPLSYVGKSIITRFATGDMYRVSIGGILNAANGASLTITMLAFTQYRSSSQFLCSTSTNKNFNIDFVFTVRNAEQFGKLSSSGSFSYVRDNGTILEGTTFGNQSVVFNGTVPLIFNAEAVFSENNVKNSLIATNYIIQKIF
jgi:hypothetical protein